MASSSSSLYTGQQQQQLLADDSEPANVNPVAAAPNRYSSGSIGPFFGVMSVLIVVAVLSCFLGKICARRKAITAVAVDDPLEMIKGGGLRGWMRRKWRGCLAGDLEAGAKVADCAGKDTAKDSEAREDAPPA